MPGEEKGHPLIEKVETLLSKFDDPAYTDDVEKIRAWRREIADLINRETLCENETLQQIIREFGDMIKKINESLINNDSTILPDSQRDRLINKRTLYIEFISKFDVVAIRKSLESVDKSISEELAALPDSV